LIKVRRIRIVFVLFRRNCTDEEFQKLVDRIQSEKKEITKRFFVSELLE